MAKKTSISTSESTITKTAKPKAATPPKRHSKATPAVPETVSASPAIQIVLDAEEVSRLAYSYWATRNFQAGSQAEDWFRAENELRQRLAAR